MDASAAFAADGVGGDFYWRYCVGTDHIDQAVEALMAALKVGGRLWNPFTEAYTRKTFKRRIEKAEQGRLRPVDEIKRVAGRTPEVKIFEIRWSHVNVQERDQSTGAPISKSVEARLYYVEPAQFGRVILGLHCHEKLTVGSEKAVSAAQDGEIARALACYARGMHRCWGVEIT